jgi:hypothetical protein
LLAIPGCNETDSFVVENGSLDLNPHLRGDFAASQGMPGGRFLSDGNCPDSAGPTDECHFVSPLLWGALTSTQLQHLRRSHYFWVDGDGFPKLTYEYVASGFDLFAADSHTLISHVDAAGSCADFPFRDPETRQLVPNVPAPFQHINSQYFIRLLFDVTVQECAADIAGADPETLAAANDHCNNQSTQAVLQLSAPGAASVTPPYQGPAPPLCVANAAITPQSMMADLSYTLTAGPAPALSPDLFRTGWKGLNTPAHALEPNLKVVPVSGVRTISRQAVFCDQTADPVNCKETANPDGSVTRQWEYQVDIDMSAGVWQENFSPNIVVKTARLRKGPRVQGTPPSCADVNAPTCYGPMTRLDIGRFRCLSISPAGDTAFMVPSCENMQGGLRVTPTYDFGTFQTAAVDNADRLLWKASVKVPAGSALLTTRDSVFLELDLTAISSFGTSPGGLRADPPSSDLGLIRDKTSSVPQRVFTLSSVGVLPVQIQSLALAGPDAAEFESVSASRLILRLASSGGPGLPHQPRPGGAAGSSGSSVPTLVESSVPVAVPFFLDSGAQAEIDVVPAFKTVGRKQAQLVITFADVRGNAQTLTLPIQANIVTPEFTLVPQELDFQLRWSATSGTAVQRAALFANEGILPITRTSASISGADGHDFLIVNSQYGLAESDPTQPITIQSGQSEAYRIGFYPSAAGDRHATLTISTDAGTLTMPLSGHCDGLCRQPAPAPTYHVKTPPPAAAVTPLQLVR